MSKAVRGDIGVRRISHVLVNVTDLDASTAYYEKLGPLRPRSEGVVDLDSSPGLDVEGPVNFKWRALDDGTTGKPTKVVLAQWTTPSMIGEAYPDITSVGLVKFAFNYSGTEQMLEHLEENDIPLAITPIERKYITVEDPDDTVVSFRYLEGTPSPQLFHVHLSTYDLPRQLAFWEGVIGLEYAFNSVPTKPTPASQGPNGGLVQWNSHFLSPTGDARFFIDIGNYRYPEPHGEPHRAANAIGIALVGLEVEDLDIARDVLVDALQVFEGTESVLLGEIETWPSADGAARRVLHLRDPDGNLVQLVERDAPIVQRPAWPAV